MEERYRQDPEEPPSSPSSPIVDIVLRHNNRHFRCMAILDTGTGYSTITKRALQILAPDRDGDLTMAGATDNEADDYPLYKVDSLFFCGVEYRQVQLVDCMTATRMSLIGRDILNKHQILLDGPLLRLTVD